MAKTYINIVPLTKLIEDVKKIPTSVLKKWVVRYRSFAMLRFDKLSKSGGGGEWPPLKASTINARRHGKFGKGKRALKKAKSAGGGQVSILVDTGTLKQSLTPTISNDAAGAYSKYKRSSVLVGIEGGRHVGTSLTVGELAVIHNDGTRHIPARPIIVEPDDTTISEMSNDLTSWLEKNNNGK